MTRPFLPLRNLSSLLLLGAFVACSSDESGSSGGDPDGGASSGGRSTGAGGRAGSGGAGSGGRSAGGAASGGAGVGGAGGLAAGGSAAGGASGGGSSAGGTLSDAGPGDANAGDGAIGDAEPDSSADASSAGGAGSGGAGTGGSASGGAAAGGATSEGGVSAGGTSSAGGAGAGGAGAGGAGAPDGGGDATVSCSDTCPFDVCDGTACAVTRVAPASSPRALTVAAGGVYWTSGSAVFACATPPCAGGTTIVGASSGHSYLGITATVSASTDFLFVTDNNYQRGLLRVGLTGTPNEPWASAPGNAAAIAASGAVVVWGDGNGVYRSQAGAAGSTKVMDPAPAFFTGSGMPNPPLQNVAVDGTTMFTASATDVYKCPVGDACVGNLVPAAAQTMGNVMALAIHEGTLYALGGTPFVVGGTEQLWSVPVAGGSVTNVGQTSPAASGGGTPFGLVADAENLYWGSLDGNLYTCSRTGTCTPRVLVPGARAHGIAQDGGHVYWADFLGSAIYRVVKP